ncbi:MAG: hypothetical protein EAZ65_02550 [Verrucomicrobia bacterium]|nr:MAG: hypothetical protein EAZ84_04810 [Verrucomicrobiota bacterium]TAE88865.1 MAG: hypothetical protein EAZ82_02175 [Verrucomicrobiota bacterium]TAF27282.1 MAG: hypothetical protein EAZ71_02140 [Verrucomicrobiota bacterium]TAF42427.1 MAG: hypothetical protein EAZ65_02550 [Verrucomicrobiota bacterium]
MNSRRLTLHSILALSGVALWTYGARHLASDGAFDYDPNPLGLKTSPYGQVIALAVQGGIDSDWHRVEVGSSNGSQNHRQLEVTTKPSGLLARLEDAATERTNPLPATHGHKFYLRREVEDRLRFAYELDPSNYANYNAYHLFLTEPSVGTRRILSQRAVRLARTTIDYSLRESSDPRPALTAAAAAGNILELMLLSPDEYDLDTVQRQFTELDRALARHRDLASRWLDSGEFQRLSPARQQEMLERFHFVTKVRDAAAGTISRLISATSEQASNSH